MLMNDKAKQSTGLIKMPTEKIQDYLRKRTEINDFYFEFLFPAIPTGILLTCKPKHLAIFMENLVHLIAKDLVNERSILDNKLAYRNLSLTQNKKVTNGKRKIV